MDETRVTDISFMAGFKFGMAATLGSFLVSMVILPAIACLLFLIISVTGGGLLSIFGQMQP